MKPKILIEAYLQINLGDDLFIKILLDRYPKYNFLVYNRKYYTKNIFSNAKNLKNISKNKLMNSIFKRLKISKNISYDKCLKKVDSIVNIGGSIFMEPDKEKDLYDNMEKRKKILQLKKKYFVLGANFGPYKTEKYKENYKEFFKNCEDVCFREKYSFELFKELKNIRYTSDIVFSLNIEPIKSEEYILISVIKPSVRKKLENYDEIYYEQVKTFIIECINRGKKVKLMSFCKYEGDEEAINDILKKVSSRSEISVYNYRGNIEEALDIINKAKVVIASRFHAMILGFISKKIVYPIVYSDKFINVLNDMEFKGKYCDYSSLNLLTFNEVMKNKSLDEDILIKLKKKAEKQFEKLDEYLS